MPVLPPEPPEQPDPDDQPVTAAGPSSRLPSAPAHRPRPPRDDLLRGFWAGYARAVRFLRFLLVPAWIVAALAAVHYLPSLTTTGSTTLLSAAVGASTPAAATQATALRDFGTPLLSQDVVVQYRASGLSQAARNTTVTKAEQLDTQSLPGLRQVAGAIPITNTGRIVSGSGRKNTVAVTYLLFRPSVGPGAQVRLTKQYAQQYLSGPGSGLVGITGLYATSNAESNVLSASLTKVELAAILLVLGIMALVFRSVLAPVVTLVSAGVAYFISQRLLALATAHLGIKIPTELSPVIVVLLLGIMTDYAVFFLSAFRDELRDGRDSRTAMVRAATQVTPIVLTAGFTVAAGVAVIQTAKLSLFAELGPGLAITVLVGVVVAATFLPAAIAIFGRFTYWPSHPRPRPPRQAAGDDRPKGDDSSLGLGHAAAQIRGLRGALARLTVRRSVAPLVLLVGVAALVVGSSPLRGVSLGLNLVSVLPSSSAPARAVTAAGKGFAPGIVAPTEVLVTGAGVAGNTSAVANLEQAVGRQPGVAGVIGLGDLTTEATNAVFVSKAHQAARFLVVLSHAPSGAAAVRSLQHIQGRMHALLSQAGLSGATVGYAGDTALSVPVVTGAGTDLVRVGLFTLAVDFLILAAFLRSLVAPVVLVAASALVVAASLGITTWVFTTVIGGPGFTFYVPFAAEVLLISFGSDYNLYLVGRIWKTEEEMPIRPAIARTAAQASSAINIAGVTLAGTFAMLAFVDLRSFHALACVMVVGIVIDTFFVRSFLVPAILSLLGRKARWPSQHVMAYLRARARAG